MLYIYIAKTKILGGQKKRGFCKGFGEVLERFWERFWRGFWRGFGEVLERFLEIILIYFSY